MCNNLEQLINEINDDLKVEEISKEETIALNAKLRIEKQAKEYDNELDQYIKSLENSQFMSSNDFKRLSSSLKSLCNIISNSYKVLLDELEHIENLG